MCQTVRHISLVTGSCHVGYTITLADWISSLSCRGRTRVLRCVTPIVFVVHYYFSVHCYTKHAACDKRVFEVLAFQGFKNPECGKNHQFCYVFKLL